MLEISRHGFPDFWSSCQGVKVSPSGKSSHLKEKAFLFIRMLVERLMIYLHVFLMRVKGSDSCVFCFSGLSRHILFLPDLRVCQRTWGQRCNRNNSTKQDGLAFIKGTRRNEKRKSWWNWGSSWSRQGKSSFLRGRTEKTTATAARSVHTLWLQVWGQIWSQIFPLILHSHWFYAAQWVEIDADTAGVIGFISHRDEVEKHLHILRTVNCFRVHYLSC